MDSALGRSLLLDGRCAIVTGGSRGIGAATARLLGAAGASVVVAGRTEAEVDRQVELIRDDGGQAMGLATHMGREAEVLRLVRAAAEAFGGPHILVNNAATNPFFGDLLEAPRWAWEKVEQVNLWGALTAIRQCCAVHMSANGGAIVNIVSVGAFVGEPALGLYAMSKAALVSMTRTLALELAPSVRVNAVAPGLIQTEFSRALWEDRSVREARSRSVPLGRLGNPEDVAEVVRFLVTDACAYVTGVVVPVDGGRLVAP